MGIASLFCASALFIFCSPSLHLGWNHSRGINADLDGVDVIMDAF